LALCATAVAQVPQWNDTKCPAWELQRPGMENFRIEELPGFYYELGFPDITQFPLCPGKSKCDLPGRESLAYFTDDSKSKVKYATDTWNLQCFGHPYPQTLLFNVTDEPGFLHGYVPTTAIPFLPKKVVASTVFPDTVVDFKAGPEGWALEMQCVELLGGVKFVGFNYYSKLKPEAAFQEMDREAAFQEMDKAARARGLGFYMDKGFFFFGWTRVSTWTRVSFKRRVDHSNCPLEPTEAEVTNPEEEACCQGACKENGKEKYWSIAASMGGTKHCGECCMDPSKYKLYHFFEKNLTKSTTDSPCEGFGYTKYDSTVTHGFGPVKMTLDLYDLPATPMVEEEACCQGACKENGEEKYWNIAESMGGTKHCGECCMDPSKYKLYHIFEKILTKSTTDSPCEGFGYTKYVSTVTRGSEPVDMTLDLYDLPQTNLLIVI